MKTVNDGRHRRRVTPLELARGRVAVVLVEICIHVANVLYLASFLCWDMLYLRVLTCLGLALGIIFFTCQPAPMYGPTAWHVLFLAINGFQIWRLVVMRRQLRLPDERQRVGAAAFQGLTRQELLDVLTRVLSTNPKRVADIDEICPSELTLEERILRDLAFSHLSRTDLLNLLTRRLWNSLLRWSPTRWKWPRRPRGRAGARPTIGPGQGSLTR
jgi:hypothetical protein